MSNKKRFLAFCVSLLTVPVFTRGVVPYGVSEGQACITSAGERTTTFDVAVTNESVGTYVKESTKTETTCGTEEGTTTEITTSMVTKTTVITATETTTTKTITTTEMQTKEISPLEETEIIEVVELTEQPRAEEICTEAEETFWSDDTTEETYIETEDSTDVIGADEFVWNGKVLTKSSGIVPADETPSGLKETWYNLPMYGCLDLMGLSYDNYDVSDDGIKTYNGYIMVASPDLSKWPKGSYIETTNGMGIVVDFCPAGNLDIAVAW